MYKFDNQLIKSDERNLFSSFGWLVLFLIVGLFFGTMVGMVAALPFFNWEFELLQSVLADPEEISKYSFALLVMQGGTAITTFILMPLLYLRIVEQKTWSDFMASKQSVDLYKMMGFTVLLTFITMPLTGLIMEWNQGIVFPEFLQGLEEWFKAKEEAAKVMTQAITKFSGTGELLVGIFVVAVVAGVGEELVFRGIVQNLMWKGTNNIHIAIWVTGFIFSAFHLQFYGLIPRMLLGVLFGYYYYWSRNIWVPILAHFINNAVTVIGIHLYNTGEIKMNIEENEAMPWHTIFISVVLSAIILYYYKRMHQQMLDNLNSNGE
jgi:membrane protease YdiL (CAAX protease family)